MDEKQICCKCQNDLILITEGQYHCSVCGHRWPCPQKILDEMISGKWANSSEVKVKSTNTPDQILHDMAETFKKRSEIYGDNYKQVGDVMMALFPDDKIGTTEDWNRFHCFFMIVVKLTRLANDNLKHKDSVHDIGVYAAMWESLL